MKPKKWKTISSKNIYSNPWMSLREDVTKDERDSERTFAVLKLPYGASVLPIDPEGNVYLIWQYRYGYGDITLETPAGKIDDGESPEEAARRETHEEIGVYPEQLIPLGTIAGLTSNVHHREYLFLAQLSHVPETSIGSEDEVMTLEKVSFEQAIAWALDGTIVHGPAITIILRAKEYLKL